MHRHPEDDRSPRRHRRTRPPRRVSPLSALRRCARCWKRPGCATGTVSRRAGTISASIRTWPMAGAIAAAALPAFAPRREAIARKPHQPHYQSRDYNPLNGGIERWFEPVTDAIGAHPAMRAMLTTCHALFDRLTPAEMRPPAWHVEIHQFRIEARPGQDGQPTPEGMHRDGVDWVLVLLVSRVNIASGETTIADLAKCAARQLYPDRSARRRRDRRQPGVSRRHPGHAARSGPARTPRRAGRDVPAGIGAVP